MFSFGTELCLSYCLDFRETLHFFLFFDKETLHFRFTFVAFVLLIGKMCGVLVSLSRKFNSNTFLVTFFA